MGMTPAMKDVPPPPPPPGTNGDPPRERDYNKEMQGDPGVPMVREVQPERRYNRDAMLGRDASSVFPSLAGPGWAWLVLHSPHLSHPARSLDPSQNSQQRAPRFAAAASALPFPGAADEAGAGDSVFAALADSLSRSPRHINAIQLTDPRCATRWMTRRALSTRPYPLAQKEADTFVSATQEIIGGRAFQLSLATTTS